MYFKQGIQFFQIKYLFIVSIILFLTACGSGSGKKRQPVEENKAPLEFDGLSGVFRSRGYGYIAQINYEENTIQIFDITENSCLLDGETSLDSIAKDFDIIRTPNSDDEFIASDFTQLFFVREAGLPNECQNGGTPATQNPEVNFEIFWETFNEHYPFFDKRNVDWAMAYEQYRLQVTASTGSEELFIILSDMVGQLADAHVRINSSFGSFNAGFTSEFLDARARSRQPAVDTIIDSYLDSGLTSALAGAIQQGTIGGSIGYLQINDFVTDGIEAIIDNFLNNTMGYEGIIIDVRKNGGGSDELALAIAGRFADAERIAYQEYAIDGTGFSPIVTHNLVPKGATQFFNPVVVLTGPVTGSAAENFVMDMLALPQTYIIGETTLGTISTVLGKSLPNGFEFTLGNEIEQMPDGTIYEVTGIFPHRTVATFQQADFTANTDSPLQAAIDYINTL